MNHGALISIAAVVLIVTVSNAQKQDPVVAHVIRSALNEENQSKDTTVLVNLLRQVVSARLDDEDRSSRAQDDPVAHNLIRAALHPAEYPKEKEEKRSAIIAAHDAVQEFKYSVIRNRDQNKAVKVPLPDMRMELKLGMEMEHRPNRADTIMHDVVRQALTTRLVDEHRIARAKGGAFIHKLLRQVLQSGMEREDSKADGGILPPINHYVVREALKAALNNEDKPTSTSKAMHNAVQTMLKAGIKVEHGPRSGLKRIHEAIQNTLKAAGLEVEPYGLTHRVVLSKGTRAVTQPSKADKHSSNDDASFAHDLLREALWSRLEEEHRSDTDARLHHVLRKILQLNLYDEDRSGLQNTGVYHKRVRQILKHRKDSHLTEYYWSASGIVARLNDEDNAARAWTGGNIKLYGSDNAEDDDLAARTWEYDEIQPVTGLPANANLPTNI